MLLRLLCGVKSQTDENGLKCSAILTSVLDTFELRFVSSTEKEKSRILVRLEARCQFKEMTTFFPVRLYLDIKSEIEVTKSR